MLLAEKWLSASNPRMYKPMVVKIPNKSIMFSLYSDPAHGWLKVSKAVLQKHIGKHWRKSFTPYSYERGNFVYLEEDQDLFTFTKLMEQKDMTVLIKQRKQSNRYSAIRGYKDLQPIGD